jgi:hypothetical protein
MLFSGRPEGARLKIRNPKPEIRMNAQNPNSERRAETPKHAFRISGLGFPSDFWFRISGFSMREITVRRSVVSIIALLCLSSLALADDAAPKPYHPLPSLYQWEAAGAPKDPIQSIDRHVGRIVGELADSKTDLPVQYQQKKVVGELDTIIKQMEEQMKSGSGSGSNPNPTKPMQKSILAGGPGGSGPLHDPKAGQRAWGDLPAKEREQILQSQTEGFPPGYEQVLSSYYNRLAQEKVSSDNNNNATPPSNGPTTQPTNP